MQNMQRLAPEMKKLQERYKDDKQRLNEEMMKFYQEHGFNPASSCLPLLLQIPFFISLFYLLRADSQFKADIAAGEESFGFITEPRRAGTGRVLVVLILLYVVTQLAASLVTAVSGDRNQKILVLVLPIVFVPILINFEAGLLVYWITTNIWTFGQQLAVKKFLPAPEPFSSGDDDDKADGAKGASSEGAGGLRGLLDSLKGSTATGSAGNGASASGAAPRARRAPLPRPAAVGTPAARRPTRRARRRSARAAGDDRRGGSAGALPDDPAERARAVVEAVVGALGVGGEVRVSESEAEIQVSVDGEDDPALLIGKHGATIDALQHIAARAAFQGADRDRKRVVIDAGGYRERRQSALERAADKAVEDALSFGRRRRARPHELLRAPDRPHAPQGPNRRRDPQRGRRARPASRGQPAAPDRLSVSRETVAALVGRYALPPSAAASLAALLEALAAEPDPPTTVADPARAVEVHLADSLSGLEVEALRAAPAIADLGSGAGFPGLPSPPRCRTQAWTWSRPAGARSRSSSGCALPPDSPTRAL